MQYNQPSTSINLVLALLKYATRFGLTAEEVFQAAGIAPTLLDNPESRVSFAQFDALWQVIAHRSGDPHFGIHLVEAMHNFPSGEVVLAVMANCPTIGQAMEKLSQYHVLATDFVQFQLTEQGEYAFYTWNLEGMPFSPDRHQVEAELGLLMLMLRNLTDDRMRFVEVRFSHAQPESIAEHQRFFRCPLVFGWACNGLVIRREDLALPVLGANPALLERLESVARERLLKLDRTKSWTKRVVSSIGEQLSRGERPLLEITAQNLLVSSRHLQNKLKAEGVTYRDVLDQVRKDLALNYLNQPQMTLLDIAFLLSFSTQSAFNHAFKRWIGCSPQTYRAALKE